MTMHIRIEKNYPTAIAIVITAVTCLKYAYLASIVDGVELVKQSLAVLAILIGFLLTAKSILISIQNEAFSKLFNSAGGSLIVAKYLSAPLTAGFLSIILAMILISFDLSSFPETRKYLALGWVLFTSKTFLDTYRAARILSKILEKNASII